MCWFWDYFLRSKSCGLQQFDDLKHYKFILLGEIQTSSISENLSTGVISVSHPHIADSGLCFNLISCYLSKKKYEV